MRHLAGIIFREDHVKRKHALIAFLGICLVLAVLLLAAVISIIAGAIIFAISLSALGGLSKVFKKDRSSPH